MHAFDSKFKFVKAFESLNSLKHPLFHYSLVHYYCSLLGFISVGIQPVANCPKLPFLASWMNLWDSLQTALEIWIWLFEIILVTRLKNLTRLSTVTYLLDLNFYFEIQYTFPPFSQVISYSNAKFVAFVS